jgi:hypothetical protein
LVSENLSLVVSLVVFVVGVIVVGVIVGGVCCRWWCLLSLVVLSLVVFVVVVGVIIGGVCCRCWCLLSLLSLLVFVVVVGVPMFTHCRYFPNVYTLSVIYPTFTHWAGLWQAFSLTSAEFVVFNHSSLIIHH